jgi:hypothetical protein
MNQGELLGLLSGTNMVTKSVSLVSMYKDTLVGVCGAMVSTLIVWVAAVPVLPAASEWLIAKVRSPWFALALVWNCKAFSND